MEYDLKGTTLQILSVELEEDETILSEAGRMAYMSDNVDMDTEATGGALESVKRAFAGESLFLVNYTPKSGKGVVGFASEVPGKIVPVELEEGETLTAQKDAWLCSKDIVPDAKTTDKISSGFLGGEGIVLLNLEGPGLVFMNIAGELEKIDLDEGEKLRVDTGCLGAFDGTMEYSVDRVEGVKNMLFGGEGIFLATIEGPGTVWVQSMPLDEFAGKISQYIDTSGGDESGILDGIGVVADKIDDFT